MKNEINSIINKIHLSLKSPKSSDVSLFSGDAGICLFNKYYLEYVNKGEGFDDFQYNLQRLAENSIGLNNLPFCNGKAGVNWFFSYLRKEIILDDSDWEMLCDDDAGLAANAIAWLEIGFYDFLHGAIGIAHHLLYSRGNYPENFFEDFFSILKRISYDDKNKLHIPNYDFKKSVTVPEQVNIGIAHGITSILQFCIECYKKNICKKEAKALALDIILFLKSHTNEKKVSYFPNIINIDKETTEYSRLAWCYGDLGIAFILYKSGLAFNDTELQSFAIEVLLHTTKRRNVTDTYVKDAGICHGSSGIAHIYNRMWHYTKDKVFKEACDFWIQETINYSVHKDTIAGYKYFEPDGAVQYVESHSLLNGNSGIGLVLISYLTGNFDWDYCFMLND